MNIESLRFQIIFKYVLNLKYFYVKPKMKLDDFVYKRKCSKFL